LREAHKNGVGASVPAPALEMNGIWHDSLRFKHTPFRRGLGNVASTTKNLRKAHVFA
jgi:hypothetical protein